MTVAAARECLLLVRARSRLCAVPLGHVVETMRPLPVEAAAGAPPFVKGISLIRGIPVPVVDLGALLGADGDAGTTRFVTLRIGDRRVALAVESIVGLREVEPSLMEGLPPLLSQAGAGVVDAIGVLDARLLVVLRAARLLPDEVWRALAGGEAAS